MKLNEYLNKLHKTPVFRGVLPMNQGALYPLFSVVNGRLCAHFLTHNTEMSNEGMKVYHPEYYLVFTYPDCTPLKFERLPYNPAFAQTDFKAFELIARPSKEDAESKRKALTEVLQLADNLLADWDEKKSADTEAYNSAYFSLLTEKQKEVLKKL